MAFLTRKWQRELDYRLIKELWCFADDRIAVRFAYEWHDDSGNWFRSYGNENWEFDEHGLMRRRIASINDLPIAAAERKFHWPLGRRPDDHPALSEMGLLEEAAESKIGPGRAGCRGRPSIDFVNGELAMTASHRHGLSRRGFCLCCMSTTAVAATGGWLTPRQAFAAAQGIVETIQAAAATAPIAVHRLRGNVAILEGSGGNIAVLTGTDGKVMIDAGIAVSRAQVAAALAGIGPEPVTHLINTHWHFDHANGNEWLHELGPQILAQENTLKHLRTMQRVEDWDYDFAPLSAGALPTEVFATERTLKLNGTTLALKYYGPAHTDSDISVQFTEADILHTGDTFWNGIYPFIDYSTGGSIDGSIRAADADLAATTDKTIIIPGHGPPVSNRAELQAFRDMLVAIRDNVAVLKQRGMSLEEIVAAKPTADFDGIWGQFVIGPALFTKLVYEGV